MEKQVLPKLKYILAQAIDTQRPSLVVRAILLIAVIVDGIRPLPEALEPFLLDRLRRLLRAVSFDDYANLNGYAALTAYMRSVSIPTDDPHAGMLWRELARLRDRLLPSSHAY